MNAKRIPNAETRAMTKGQLGISANSESVSIRQRLIKFTRRGFIFGAVVASVSGCGNIIRRGQSPDKIPTLGNANGETTYIGDVCGIWGLGYDQIEGIGMVTGLEGTGSNPSPSGQRDHLISELKSKGKISKPKTALASKNTSMVVIQGALPPGLKKGERFDIKVKTMPDSETKSLKFGRLVQARMRPMMRTSRTVKLGTVNALAKGTVMVDSLFESRQDEPNDKQGWILGGGVALEDREMGLTVRTEETKVRVTRSIAHSINERFTTESNNGREGVAKPKTDRIVKLIVPSVYKHNIGRYFQVLVAMAVGESESARVNRLDKLDREIGDPAMVQRVTLELEAIGDEAVPVLKRALKHPTLAVRFYAAQALAYMQHSDGVGELEEIAAAEPSYRWHSLMALASLEKSEAGSALRNLFHAESAETRYGAFRSMIERSPNDVMVKGKWLANDFFYHVIPSSTAPMLHFSRSKRPEIVVFGESQTISDDFLHVESGLTIQANGNGRVTVVRYLPQRGEIRKSCSTAVTELIPLLAEMGCDYSMLIGMFRDAKKSNMLNTRLAVNALPRIEKNSNLDSMTSRASGTPSDTADPIAGLFSADARNQTEPAEMPERPAMEPETKSGNLMKRVQGLFQN